MYEFELNSQPVALTEDINLLEYLREDARLTSVKNGCGEGACGACMVLVNGDAVRACLLTAAKVNGKRILTVEGFSDREKELYAWAFADAGAVQCGFCIPGMIISAKSLLDRNPNPDRQQVKAALRGNVCRCTGYVKIEQAIMKVAQFLRSGNSVPAAEHSRSGIGVRLPRVDAEDKVLGRGEYVDDLKVEGMLHAVVLRAEYPRALVKSISTSEAKAYPGVAAVLTAEDIPGSRYLGFLAKDWPALVAVGEETHYAGDALALVAAISKKAAREALNLIRVEYQELTPVTNPKEALASGAPLLHPSGNVLSTTKLQRGDAAAVIETSAHVVTQIYRTPPTEHAFLEPESALAVPQPDGRLTVYVGSQSVYEDQHGIALLLGLPCQQIRVISKLVGGAFGGKEDLSVQHHAALLAWYLRQPVKLTLSRQESIRVHPKRHAMEMEVTSACDEQGRLTAIRARIVSDTGAYASLGGPVLQRACTHLAGPYQVLHVDIEGKAVYTNNPPGGAFRGFGVPQSVFASEANLDLLAGKVGISPWEIRYRNVLEPGMTMASGQLADESTAIKETLLAVREAYDSSPYTGIACTMKNTGIGVGVPDKAQVIIRVVGGKAVVLTSAACLGQGLSTVLNQIVSETCGLPSHKIEIHSPDTDKTPDAGTTTASRQTMFTGEAARQAALALQTALSKYSLSELENEEYHGEYLGITDPLNAPKNHPVNHVAYGYATQVVVLNAQGRVTKVVAAHDVGKAINPTAIEGQIEGAVAMGLGYALKEDFPLAGGVPTAKFGSLGLLRTTDMPEIDVLIIEKNPSPLAYGAKGVGEIATIPTAPAVASAYYRLDGIVRTKLPLVNTFYRKG